MPTDDGDTTTGRLIDFDHAKVSTEFTATIHQTEQDDVVPVLKSFLSRRIKQYSIDEEVIIKALQAFSSEEFMHAIRYITNAITMRQQIFDLGSSGRITCSNLHWDKKVSKIVERSQGNVRRI
jgi:hypothetical protein